MSWQKSEGSSLLLRMLVFLWDLKNHSLPGMWGSLRRYSPHTPCFSFAQCNVLLTWYGSVPKSFNGGFKSLLNIVRGEQISAPDLNFWRTRGPPLSNRDSLIWFCSQDRKSGSFLLDCRVETQCEREILEGVHWNSVLVEKLTNSVTLDQLFKLAQSHSFTKWG